VGRLVLVATPIGNLGDLAPRAVDELAGADVIVCEDTRRTRQLLTHAGVRGPRRIVANEHTEAAAAAQVVELLATGATVAVVTDAGTPGVSDPGERLVRAAIAAGHDVSAVPGPSAALAALVASGLPTDRFVVEGFLPRRGPARAGRLDEIAGERRTTVLFEAPHRLAATLADLSAVCGADRTVVLARELTKVHEELWRGRLGEALDHVARQEPRGEHVVVLAGAPPPAPATAADIDAALQAKRAARVDRKTAVSEVARELGAPRRAVYDAALRLYPGRS
jgi:16S rRNA (cytidine1402-2'-O)-methyltransferase